VLGRDPLDRFFAPLGRPALRRGGGSSVVGGGRTKGL